MATAKTRDERPDALKEEHRAQIAEMYLRKRLSQQAIAAELNISQATVSRDISVLKARWKKEGLQKVEAAQAERIAELSEVKKEAWEGWQRSKQNKERQTTKMLIPQAGDKQAEQSDSDSGNGPVVIEQTVVIEGQAGDPRFLDQVQKAIGLEAEILGLKAQDNMIKLPMDALIAAMDMGLSNSEIGKVIGEIVLATWKQYQEQKTEPHKQHSVRSE